MKITFTIALFFFTVSAFSIAFLKANYILLPFAFLGLVLLIIFAKKLRIS